MKVNQKPRFFLADIIALCAISAILSGMIVYTVFVPAPSRPHNVAPQPSTPTPTFFVYHLDGSVTPSAFCPQGFITMQNSECFPSGTAFYSVYRTNGSTIETKVVISAISYNTATNTTTIRFTGGTITVNSYQTETENTGGWISNSYGAITINTASFKGQALFNEATIGSHITLTYYLQTTHYDVAVMSNGHIVGSGILNGHKIIFTGFSA